MPLPLVDTRQAFRPLSREIVGLLKSLTAADAFFAVSWAGEPHSRQWLDIGREFTEVWHHGAQIRDAVGAGPFSDPQWLRAVLRIAMHTLPHAYRSLAAPTGTSIAIRAT